MGGFFPGLFGDLLKLLQTDAPFPFELAEQLAQGVAADGALEANPDPVERIRLEGLLGIATLHVGDVTGMPTTASGRAITLTTTTRSAWALRLLANARPLFERLAAGLRPAADPLVGPDGERIGRDLAETTDEEEEAAAFFAKWTGAIAPAMVAMQFGSLVGHLARRTLGQYGLPIPGASGDEIAIPTANLSAFAEDWSIPFDDLCLSVLVRDVATHAILSRPHVAARLVDLLAQHAEGLQPSPKALEERLGEAEGLDLSDVSALMGVLGDPSAIGDLIDTPEFRRVRAELSALGATISGYVEWVADEVGLHAIGTAGTIREALRRSRTALAEEDRGGDVLFGELTSLAGIDRGERFVRGVIERGGADDLARLWTVEGNLPTPAEVDAPGLWLERIHLPVLDGPGAGSAPFTHAAFDDEVTDLGVGGPEVDDGGPAADGTAEGS